MNKSDRLRIYGNIRTAHLERLSGMVPARVIFNKSRYDYQESVLALQARPVQMSRLGVIRHLLTTRYESVEVNEPMVWKRWPDLLAQVIAIRLRGGLGRNRTDIVAYGIGYADPALEIRAQRGWVPLRAAKTATWLAANVLIRATDRLAFGTQGSMDLYRTYAGPKAIDRRSRLFEALPAPCDCVSDPGDDAAGVDTLLFVGAFSDRKGIRQLMAAWDVLRTDNRSMRLHLIGKGNLTGLVREWTAKHPEVCLDVDPPREFIHRSMRAAKALILLSQPIGAWREQIGLPIVEGLSHGLEIVSSDETGMATWLASHGHRVVPFDSDSTFVSVAVLGALGTTRTKHDVLDDLPAEDQRVAADRWLMSHT